MLLFDRTRSLSLHLFEHVHGESRDRGQAMIDLKSQYEQAGLLMTAAELPDFCRYSWNTLRRGRSRKPTRRSGSRRISLPRWLSVCASASLLTKRCFGRWLRFRLPSPRTRKYRRCLQLPDPDADDLAALDAAWEDEPVSFGPGSGDGCKDGLIARVRGGLRPAPDMPAPKSVSSPRH